MNHVLLYTYMHGSTVYVIILLAYIWPLGFSDFLDLIILNVLMYKEKIHWHFLHLVKDNANVLDVSLQMSKSVYSSLFYCNSLL